MAKQREKIEVFEGQVLETALLSDDGGTVLCKAGTIMTPDLIRRLSNWVVRVEPGKKKQDEDETAPAGRVNRDEILRRLEFEEIVSQKTRERAESSQGEFFDKVRAGQGGLSLDAIEDAVAAMVEETPDDPDVPVKLFEMKQHSSYMYQHCMECGVMGSFIATNLKYPHKDVMGFAMALMLHDVGILTVPDSVLTKKTALTAEEWALVRGHSERGFEALKKVPGMDPLALMTAMGHHVYADGSGYPESVDFNDLPPLVHLAVVINDFETLTAQHGPFRQAANLHDGVSILLRHRHRYHPTAIEQFVRVIGFYPISTFVQLNTGETGVVVRNNPDNLFLPEIKMVLDPDGAEFKKEIIVNLFEDSERRISAVRSDL
jgi:HD-GYP domain-containing protein (c-di-GMP phosphodiesterase class II)